MSAAPTTIHLVRHGAHSLLPHTLAGRMPGVGLSPDGMHQALGLAAHLSRGPVAAVVSSPVQRAAETAGPIAHELGLHTILDEGLQEIDFGEWTGQRFEALDADPAWHRWNRLRSLASCPGGETMHAAQSRALSCIGAIRRNFPGATVVAVSHSDIIKAILAPALGLSLDHLHRLTIDPASISTLVLFDADVRVDGVNLQASGARSR